MRDIDSPVQAITAWPSNAELILACSQLGYLKQEWLTLDATYGENSTWWKRWRPDRLITNDLGKGHPDLRFDFRRPPFAEHTFDVVAYDPPFKYNGAPTEEIDARYGVEVYTRWQDRRQLCKDGITGLAPLVRSGGFLLVKCMDQTCSGKKRWQTHEFAHHAEGLGMRLADQLHLLRSPRPQPPGRRQVHAQQNFSTLLILRSER